MLFFIVFIFLSFNVTSQTTEVFEDDTVGLKTFTDNGQSFTIVDGVGESTYDIETFAGGGYNGTTADDKFIDNSSGSPAQNDGSSFSIKTTDGTDITIKSLYLFVATRNPPFSIPSTTLTITGKINGATAYTITKSSGFSDVANFTPHNGFTFIDFSSEGGSNNSNTNIDELIISTTSNADYLALDALTWDVAISNTDPTIAIDNTTLNYTEGDAVTQIDAVATVSDADGDADWNGGTLVAQITANNEAADELSISDTDGDGTAITISGTNILANGTDIGDLSASGGTVTNGTALTITFDSDATNANVQEVLQSLRYRNTSASPGTSNRTVTITATDTNTGSANDTRTIAVAAAPDVTNVVVPASATYATSNNLDFTIIFNENITVNTTGGTPQLALTIGATTRQATYVSGTGTTALLFRYTVQAGDNDTDGISVVSLANNGGTLQNGSGTNAILTLNGVGSTSGVLVDTTNPADPVVTTPATAVTVNSATQTISGTHTENGVTVHAYADNDNNGTADNSTSLGSATVTGNAWSFSVNLTSDAVNNFVVQAVDGAGNTSNDVDVSTITEDSTNPANPIVATPASAITVNSATQTISGTHTENGVTVHAYADSDNNGTADNSTSLGSSTVTGNAWSFSVNLTQNTANNFVVQAVDEVGNTSSDVDVPTITDNAVVTWTGATNTDWHTGTNWSTNTEPVIGDDVIIPNGLTNYPSIAGTANSNTITVESGAVIVQNGIINGTITFKRNLATTNWYLISSPVNGETITDFRTNNTFATGSVAGRIGLAPYDNTQAVGSRWNYQTTTSTGSMNMGEGFSVKLAAAGDLIFTGTGITANPITRGIATGAGDAFNLIGNPYLSYYDSNAFLTDNTSLLTSQTIWIWNQATNSYDTKVAADNFKLAPAQGFFVECQTNGSVEFDLGDQSSTGNSFQKGTSKTEIHVNISSNKESSKTKFYFIDGTTKGFDNGYDGKMFTGIANNFAIYSQLVSENKGVNYAIQSLPKKEMNGYIIPVGLNAKAGKEIEFSTSTLNLPENIFVYLEDKTNNKFINLSESTYKTTLAKDANGIGQFYLHTSAKKLDTPLDIAIEDISVYKSSPNTLTVVGLQTNASLKLFSILGKEVVRKDFSSNGISTINIPSLGTGVYIVEIASEKGKMSKKIILD